MVISDSHSCRFASFCTPLVWTLCCQTFVFTHMLTAMQGTCQLWGEAQYGTWGTWRAPCHHGGLLSLRAHHQVSSFDQHVKKSKSQAHPSMIWSLKERLQKLERAIGEWAPQSVCLETPCAINVQTLYLPSKALNHELCIQNWSGLVCSAVKIELEGWYFELCIIERSVVRGYYCFLQA